MKRPILLLLLSCFTFLAANAQTEKGTFLLSGSLNFSNQKYDFSTYNTHTTVFTIQPQAGWFVSNHFAVGVAPLYTYSRATNNQPDASSFSTTSSSLGGGIFARYYLMFTPQFGLYPQLNADYVAGLHRNSSNSLDAVVVPNFVFFPLPKIGINFGIGSIGYLHQKGSDGSVNNTFGFNANNTSGLTLGVSYHL